MIKESHLLPSLFFGQGTCTKFYQETLELKPTTTAMEGAWVEYDLADDNLRWLSSRRGNLLATERRSLLKLKTSTRALRN